MDGRGGYGESEDSEGMEGGNGRGVMEEIRNDNKGITTCTCTCTHERSRFIVV